MTKRKGKSNNKQDDSLVFLEQSAAQPRGLKEYAVPFAVFFIFVVVGSTAVWFCCQQQQTIESLTETVNAMQLRVTKFQQQLGIGNAQVTNVGVFEDRLRALEEAYMQAQQKVDVALATSEKIKSTDLHSQVWSLQSEMNAKLSELQQSTVSTDTLNAVVKNKTEELDKLKQSLSSVLSANSEIAVSISGLTDTVLVTTSRLDEQMSTLEGLTSQLEQQRTDLSSLKESFAGNKKALKRNRQEVIDIKELLEMEQARRTQALEDQLLSVRRSLEDHQKSTHSLHSHLAAQFEIVQRQMLSQSQQPSTVEEEFQAKQEATEDTPVRDEELNKAEHQTETEEEANVLEVHIVKKDVVEENAITPKKEPAEDVQVIDEESIEEQAEEEGVDDQAEEGGIEEQAEEGGVEEQAEEGGIEQQAEDGGVEEQAEDGGMEEQAEEGGIEEQAEEGGVEEQAEEGGVEEQAEEGVEEQAEEGGVEEQAEEGGVEEQAEEGGVEEQAEEGGVEQQDEEGDVQEQDEEMPGMEDVAEEKVTEDYEQPEEVQFKEEVVEEQALTLQKDKPEELDNKEDVDEDQVLFAEEEPVEDLQVQGVLTDKEQPVTEEDVILEEVQVKNEDAAKEMAANHEDEESEEVQVHEEQATEEQTEEALTATKETESNKNAPEVVMDLLEDPLVLDGHQDESDEETIEKPAEETEEHRDLSDYVYDSEGEDEELAEEVVDEVDKLAILANDA